MKKSNKKNSKKTPTTLITAMSNLYNSNPFNLFSDGSFSFYKKNATLKKSSKKKNNTVKRSSTKKQKRSSSKKSSRSK